MKKSINPWNGTRWIAIDAAQVIHARINGCSRGRAAAIARVMFPELESLRIVGLHPADRRQYVASKDAPLLTPESCERQGIALPPEFNPPVGFLAAQLKQRFPRVQAKAAGGGR